MKHILKIYLIIGAALCIQGYKRFGLDCGDIACESGERCIISTVPCDGPDQREGELCGSYPECEKDQLARDFSIDTTLTIANTRIPTSTSTNRNRTDTDADFELLTDFGQPDNSATHAGQTQANVLVIVQDGSQPQPNPWLNRRQNVPCTVSPIYPYACTYPGYAPNPGVGLPSYPQARSANVPQLVPPTPPCYYNCYPRMGASPSYRQYGYPLARTANPSSTNNYLLYLTLSSG